METWFLPFYFGFFEGSRVGVRSRVTGLVVLSWEFFVGKGTRLLGLVVLSWRFFMGKGTRLLGLVVLSWRFKEPDFLVWFLCGFVWVCLEILFPPHLPETTQNLLASNREITSVWMWAA